MRHVDGKQWLAFGLTLLMVGCASVHFDPLTKVDRKVNGFTKHYEEGFFKIGDNGIFSVELVTIRERFHQGKNRFDVIVHHVEKGDTEGADIKVEARLLPGGAMHKPRIWEEEYGLYNLTDLAMDKPGDWELQFTVSKDKETDIVAFIFEDLFSE